MVYRSIISILRVGAKGANVTLRVSEQAWKELDIRQNIVFNFNRDDADCQREAVRVSVHLQLDAVSRLHDDAKDVDSELLDSRRNLENVHSPHRYLSTVIL